MNQPFLNPPTRIAWYALPLVRIAALSVGVALIVALTGGQASPWTGFLYLPLVLAGFVSVAAAAWTALGVSALYVAAAVSHPHGPRVAQAEAAIQVALFFLVALVTADLVRRADARRQQIYQAATDAQHAMDIQHMINTAYDLDVTLDLVLLKQREMLRADSYAVMLVEGTTLKVSGASGLSAEGKSVRLGLHEDEHGWVPADGRPFVLADTESSPSRLIDLDPAARSVLVVPLQSVERLVGLLYFGCRQPNGFSASDVDRAEAFANRVVFPIQRALLEEELRRLAFTDSQTTLYNHRHFQGQLDEEVRRAQRYGRPVSIILMDIDNFKSFNDQYGHPAGDKLLRDMSQVLKDNLRTVDIPARYGGEEFVIICPETQRDQAILLADRLRAVIFETEMELQEGIPVHVSVSVGVAAFPPDAQNKSELVDAADHALYEAKRTGKNRVVAYTGV